MILEDLHALFDCGHRLLADLFDETVADVSPRQPEQRREQLDDALQVELVGQLDSAFGQRAEQPTHQALAQMVEDVVLEPHDAALDALDQVAEEADGVLYDVPDHVGHPRERVHQHRRQLANRVDDGLDCADRLVDESLVLGLQFLDALVETLAGLDILRSQGVDDGVLFGVDVVFQLLELVGDLLGRLRANLLQAGGQAVHVGGDLGLARGDPLLRCGQVIADDAGHPGDDAIHLLEVQLAPGLVEFVDLRRHAGQLVPEPTISAEPAAVSVLLVGRHLRRNVRLEVRAGVLLARFEFLLDLRVDRLEDLAYVFFGLGVDGLHVRGDLGALGLVLRLCLALVGDQLGQGRPLGALHAGHAGLGLGGRFGLGLGDGVLLLLAELSGCGVGVCGRLLLIGKRLLEIRLVRLRQSASR